MLVCLAANPSRLAHFCTGRLLVELPVCAGDCAEGWERPSNNGRPENGDVLTVFGYYASSICITVVLAGFLAILFDPLVVKLERLHMPRSVAAAGIVLAGIGLIGLLGYALYGRAMSFAEELPVYASTIQQTIAPIRAGVEVLPRFACPIAGHILGGRLCGLPAWDICLGLRSIRCAVPWLSESFLA